MAEPAYSLRRVDTAALPADERLDFWSEHVCRNHGTLHVRFGDPGGFRGATVVLGAERHQLVDFWSGAIHYRRTDADTRRDADESGRLLIPLAGTFHATQHGRTVDAAPGHAVVLTKARPFEVSHDGGARALLLNLPGPGYRDRSAGPAVLTTRRGVGAVIASMVAAVAAQGESLAAADFRAASDAVCDLLREALRPPHEPVDRLGAITAAVADHVRRHADDPALTPTRVASDLGWSVRQIQLALRRAGTTPADAIRDARLDLAHRALTSGPASRSVTEIAYASGFRSLSAFGEAFKRRYGATPSQARGD